MGNQQAKDKLFIEDKRLALIIACSNYEDHQDFCNLPWAENDAKSMKALLTSMGF
jgi:uncharacterized caspase-like protein